MNLDYHRMSRIRFILLLFIAFICLSLTACQTRLDEARAGQAYHFSTTYPWGDPRNLSAQAKESMPPLPPLKSAAPETAVLIYTAGSLAEFLTDRCEMDRIDTRFGPPSILAGLDGRTVGSLTLVFDPFCTPTRVGTFLQETGEGEPKFIARSQEIAARARAWQAAGVPASHILLAGFSAGGWASLTALAEAPEIAGGVIAFSPAFAGPKRARSAGWENFRRAEVARLQKSSDLRALVFGFPDDAFEPAADLSFLADIRGVQFVEVEPARLLAVQGCEEETLGHYSLFNRCFQEAYWPQIRDFILAQFAAAEKPAGS